MRQKYTGPETDVWSLGVILYTLIAGELPFDDDSEIMMQRKIVNVDYELPTYFSSELQDLISNMLKHDPKERLTMEQIVNHPWMLAMLNENDEKHMVDEDEEEIGMDDDDDSSSSTRNSSRSDIDSIFSSPRFKNDDDDDLLTEISSHDSYIHYLDNNGKSGDLMQQQQYRRSVGNNTMTNYNDSSKFSPQVRYSLGMMRPEEKARYTTSSRSPRFSAPTVSTNSRPTSTMSQLPCRSSLPLSLPTNRESIRPSSISSTSSIDNIPMTAIEQKLSNALLSAGFDEYIVQSMRTNACSSANTLWNMLMEKQQQQLDIPHTISPDSPTADHSKILHANERWSALISTPNRLSTQTISATTVDSSCQTHLTYSPTTEIIITANHHEHKNKNNVDQVKCTPSTATINPKPIEIDASSQISYPTLSSKHSSSSLKNYNSTSLTAKSSIRSISSTNSTSSNNENKAGWFSSVKTWFGGSSTKQDMLNRRPISYRDFDVYQPSATTTTTTTTAIPLSENNQGQLTPPMYRSGTLKYKRHMLPGNETNPYEQHPSHQPPLSSYIGLDHKGMDPLVSLPPPTASMYSRPVADGLSIITTPKYVGGTALPSQVKEVDICEERNPLYHQPLPPPAPPAPSYTNNSKNSNNRQCYQNQCLPRIPIQQSTQHHAPQQQPSPPPSPPDSKPMVKEIPSKLTKTNPSSTTNTYSSNNHHQHHHDISSYTSPAPSPIPTAKKITTDSALSITPPSTHPVEFGDLLSSSLSNKENNMMMHYHHDDNNNTVPTPTVSTTSTLVEKDNNEKLPTVKKPDVSPIPSLSSKSIPSSPALLNSHLVKPLSSRSSPALLASNNNSNNSNTVKTSPTSNLASGNRRFEFAPRSRLSVYGMNDRGLMSNNRAIIEEEEEEE
ncbi:unnamed protein product [Cunninghamella blakesleeana]